MTRPEGYINRAKPLTQGVGAGRRRGGGQRRNGEEGEEDEERVEGEVGGEEAEEKEDIRGCHHTEKILKEELMGTRKP